MVTTINDSAASFVILVAPPNTKMMAMMTFI